VFWSLGAPVGDRGHDRPRIVPLCGEVRVEAGVDFVNQRLHFESGTVKLRLEFLAVGMVGGDPLQISEPLVCGRFSVERGEVERGEVAAGSCQRRLLFGPAALIGDQEAWPEWRDVES
jgi:hypothetical protein